MGLGSLKKDVLIHAPTKAKPPQSVRCPGTKPQKPFEAAREKVTKKRRRRFLSLRSERHFVNPARGNVLFPRAPIPHHSMHSTTHAHRMATLFPSAVGEAFVRGASYSSFSESPPCARRSRAPPAPQEQEALISPCKKAKSDFFPPPRGLRNFGVYLQEVAWAGPYSKCGQDTARATLILDPAPYRDHVTATGPFYGCRALHRGLKRLDR